MSQGRCLLPKGPPERSAKVSRALFLSPSPLDDELCRQFTPRTIRVPPIWWPCAGPVGPEAATRGAGLASRGEKETEKETRQICLPFEVDGR